MPRHFLQADEPLTSLDGTTICDFWRWAYSDVLSNTVRSTFGEFLVGKALGCLTEPRVEWDSVDLRYAGFGIEVKTSAYCQSWFQSKPSKIIFSVRKATFWNPETGKYEGEPTRSAHCYVFCHYPEQDRAKANVLAVPSWDFYVTSIATINDCFGTRKTISLASVKRHSTHAKFDGLKRTVDTVLRIESVTPEAASGP